jgi:hypothetical protein
VVLVSERRWSYTNGKGLTMKHPRNSVFVISLLAALALTNTATAYYAPKLGRWISRDPADETASFLPLPAAPDTQDAANIPTPEQLAPSLAARPGPLTGQLRLLPSIDIDTNLYRYAAGDPLKQVDLHGLGVLTQLISCCAGESLDKCGELRVWSALFVSSTTSSIVADLALPFNQCLCSYIEIESCTYACGCCGVRGSSAFTCTMDVRGPTYNPFAGYTERILSGRPCSAVCAAAAPPLPPPRTPSWCP